MRIDKLLAHTGYGSRKDVRKLLKDKAVTVDGEIIRKPNVHVDPETEEIYVQGEKVTYQKYIYVMLNKPQGYLSATFDRHTPTVIDLMPEEYQHFSLAPVGRLDKDTEGFVLLTNDGAVNHLITSPKNNVMKTYFAKVDGKVTEAHRDLFHQGVELDDGYVTKPALLNIIKSGDLSEIELSITEGKFHQVKRMFQAIGTEVVYLKRLSIGELTLDDELELGETRVLNEKEMAFIATVKGEKDGTIN